ncbi:MAG TPA: molybdopterin-binding protein [Candidatus Hodarchaeales archaeon]|nr:molybdopterin-binding protein [Candidatus Hodarchaeales archaeon]
MTPKDAIKTATKAFEKFTTELISVVDRPINGMILRQDLVAARSHPPFDRSAVDGFAVRAEDTFGALEKDPVALQIIEVVDIGILPRRNVVTGTAIQVATGGLMPTGSNSVIMFEDTEKKPKQTIEVYSPVYPGKNVSYLGEDFTKGQPIFGAGHLLTNADRAYILGAGIFSIVVSKTPNICLIPVGNELTIPVLPLSLGKIPELNSTGIYDLCVKEGWLPKILPIVPDDKELIRKTITEGITDFDVVVLMGGTSVGEKDFVPLAIGELGTVLFHGVSMHP